MMLTLLWLSIFTTSAWAAPFETELERNVNLQLGTKAIPQRTLDNDITECRVSFTRNQWTDPIARLRLRIEHSLDGGATWLWGECTFAGLADGATTHPAALCVVPFRAGPNRLLRGEYEVSGARFRATAVLSCA